MMNQQQPQQHRQTLNQAARTPLNVTPYTNNGTYGNVDNNIHGTSIQHLTKIIYVLFYIDILEMYIYRRAIYNIGGINEDINEI